MFKNEFMAKVAFNTMQVVRKYNNETDIETWDLLNEKRKIQVMKTVEAVLKNPEITACDMHDEWEKAKLDDGWTYAPVTDRKNKKHACLVDFELLNDYQKMKDDIFIEIVKNIHKNIDYVKDEYLDFRVDISK
jgi:hypothetical protein